MPGRKREIFAKDPKKTYGLLELVEGTGATVEKKPEQTEFTWPNLVYIELIAAVAVLCILTLWSLLVQAPLEDIANGGLTPNPAKAPWYFLGLQELLVYFDPWFAGVIAPSLIIVGLMAIPYLDFNSAVQGGYAFSRRKFAVWTFTFGLALWWILIIIGVFLRGPSWNWYWFWESQEIHKPIPAGLWSFPDIGMPVVAGIDLVGTLITAVFLFVVPVVVLAMPRFRSYLQRMGFVRYGIMMSLFMLMMLVPLKIVLRLVFNLKYLMITPWFKV